MTPADVLRAARQRILAKGWSAGIGRCILMTIEAVIPDDLWYGAARPQLAAFAALRQVTAEPCLVTWNARQTASSVLVALDRAIDLTEQR